MGLNAVADQFRKWKRQSQNREQTTSTIPNINNNRQVEINHLNEKLVKTSPVISSPPPISTQTKKVRKPPHTSTTTTITKKQYPPSPDTLLQGIGDYTFIQQIGQGKFSRVMLSYHYLTKKQVAIKIIDKRIHDYRVMSRLVREIALMEVLDHPNIVKLYETYETTDSLYLVMEYVEGLNLEEFLQKRGGKLSEIEARNIFRQMAAAMDYCHSKWVVHRDLKAPNILLTKNNQVKIADFGLGNRFGRRRLKTICGSMLYYSPEIINGYGYTGPEVDCWCLGVSLYRMTVGEEPFSKANTVGDLRKDVTSGNFTIPNHVSKELRDTIMKCMSVDKTKRARVHLALKGDKWLTENGALPEISTYDTPFNNEEKKLKYMYMKDMEEEKRSKKLIKRTLVCHPKSPSMYFTSLLIPHSSKPEDIFMNSERQRHLLLQKINEIACQIQLSPTQHGSINKSPIRHLLRKLKQPENSHVISSNSTSLHGLSNTYLLNTGSLTNVSSENNNHNAPAPPRSIIRKSTSNVSLSQLYQRVAKDQIHYYTFKLTPQIAMKLTGVGESSVSLQNNMVQQDEITMMCVICSICDIMGITYNRVTSDRLMCVMALNDYINDIKPTSSFYKLKRRDSKMISSNPSINTNDGGSQASFSRSSTAGLSDTNRSSSHHFINNSRFSNKFKRITSHVLSSIFPYHSSTVVTHESRSLRFPPFPNVNTGNSRLTLAPPNVHRLPTAAATSKLSSHIMSNNNNNPDEEDSVDKKQPGIAVFSIEIISLTKDIQKNRIVALKLSKLDGSSKVFRIACGWITGVIQQNMMATTTEWNDPLLATDIIPTSSSSSSSHYTPFMIQHQSSASRHLLRPKSVITLLPVKNDSPPPTFSSTKMPSMSQITP